MDHLSASAFDDNSEHVQTEYFDYDEISRRLKEPLNDPDGAEELANLAPEEIEKYLLAVRVIIRWLWQDGMNDSRGLTIRAVLACWIFIEELRPLSMSDMARGFGCRDKQSLGRWHDEFKRQFPTIKTPHMKTKAKV